MATLIDRDELSDWPQPSLMLVTTPDREVWTTSFMLDGERGERILAVVNVHGEIVAAKTWTVRDGWHWQAF